MGKKISIIIPCYNVEKYIWDCYLSLKKQTLGIDCLEIIFIDDCSTDSTWQKLSEMEADCPDSVMIIHCEENGRQGRARNIGLMYATAPFVAFVDADDWVEPDIYEKMYDKAREYGCDVVCCDFIRDYGERNCHITTKESGKKGRLLLVDSIEKRKQFILAGSMGYVAWNKLMKKELLTDNELYFPEKLVYEDNYWCSALYLYACHVYILEEKLYHYRVNFQSVVLKQEQPYYRDFLAVNLLKWQEWENRGLLQSYYEELSYDFLITCYLGYLKLLFLRLRKPSFEEFQLLKQEVLGRIPDYHMNPYLTSHFTPFNQLLLDLLKLPITPEIFAQVMLQARVKWQKVRIFVTHVMFPAPEDTIYQTIHVGNAVGGDLGYPGDDTGDNISALNKYYGELTGLYWIWKNYHTADYVGLCLYCRYFINEERELLKKEDYIRILSEYDVIIARPMHNDKSYYEIYEEAGNIRNLTAVEEAVGKLYPEYLPYFEEVIHGRDSYAGNLFVTSKGLWDAYASWLFSVFREASGKIPPDDYDTHHGGGYGFLSGQLLYVWIQANGLTWYGCPAGFSQEKAEP